ncbi:MAG TPA: hypothetical protein ENN66_09355, partial [Proteobacteria bacterium]|nr:hypothetical protein [Pseudomonadota bacterium]
MPQRQPEPTVSSAQEKTTATANRAPAQPKAREKTKSDRGTERRDNQAVQKKPRPQLKGIAALFEREELKDLFRTYLITICVIEGFIFFVSFLSQLGPENVPFPWKSYFFSAFITPLVITFLLGVIVISFDRYLFGHQPPPGDSGELLPATLETRGRIHKFHAFLYVIRQVPFLLGLLCLLALSALAYKLNDILAILGHVGERTAHYSFIGLAVLFAAAVIFGLIWMCMSYNLRKKTLEFEYQYRKDVVERTGLILIGQDRVMTR